jgi:hypothetical protein
VVPCVCVLMVLCLCLVATTEMLLLLILVPASNISCLASWHQASATTTPEQHSNN